jgi:hypothetical protein
MSKKGISVIIILVLSTVSLAETSENKLGVTFDLTYMSKYMTKGKEGYGQQGALFKTVDVDLYGSGFGFKVTHRNATSSGYVDKQRFDFSPYYRGQLFEEKPYATNYNISFAYEYYPGLTKNKANTTYEWVFAFSWPNILPNGLVPSYIAHYEYPAGSNYKYSYITGWVHRFKLDYDLNVPELPQPLRLSSEVAYTDGLGGAAHDWSYATFGISTKLKITDKLTFVPGLYQQISMDNSVSRRKDITYCILSMKYKL